MDHVKDLDSRHLLERFRQPTPCSFQELEEITRSSTLAVKLSVCVTIYNEGRAFVEQTVDSLMVALSNISGDAAVFLIFDGLHSMDLTTIEYLVELGLIGSVGPDAVSDFSISYTQTPLRDGRPAKLFSVVKSRNGGKRDSHLLFYRYLCTLVVPSYCIQIDAGIWLDPASIKHLMYSHELDDKVCVVVPCSTINTPNLWSGLTLHWQFGNIFYERILRFPAELKLGFISVIPGQFHSLNWHLFSRASIDDTQTLLSSYLDSCWSDQLVERNLSQAEDRITANDLAINFRNELKIVFSVDSKAAIDECQTLTELLRQRRRWICGGISGKMHCIERSWQARGTEKTKQWILIFYHSFTLLVELLYPGLAVLISFYFAQQAAADLNFFGHELTRVLPACMLYLYIASFVTTLFLGRSRLAATILVALQSLTTMLLIGVAAVTLIRTFTRAQAPPLAAYWGAYVVLLAYVSHKQGSGSFHRHVSLAIAYLATRPFMSFITTVYAISRFGVTAWGTKGIVDAITPHGGGKRMKEATIIIFVLGLNILTVCWLKSIFAAALFLALVPITLFALALWSYWCNLEFQQRPKSDSASSLP